MAQIIMGRVNDEYTISNGLLGKRGFIKLDVMENDFVTVSNVTKSRYRMMYHFKSYVIVDTGMESASGDKIFAFCLNNMVNDVINECKLFEGSDTVFAWDIVSDWIVTNKESVMREIKDDYENWWMKIPEILREERFWEACK